MKLGSLFTGYGGLDMAAGDFFGAETVWTSDIDPGACKIIAHRFPDVPNLGDITAVDWNEVEPVDVLTGGFPCQDLSHAGKRAGMRPGTRSGLWSHMAYAISQLRPRYVVAENVRGLLSAHAHSDLEPCPWCVGGSRDGEPDLRALGAVLGDLADIGYDARWVGLRAADIGAPHGRFRVFVVAADAAGQQGGLGDGNDVRTGRGTVGREPATGRGATADANDGRGNGTGLYRPSERWRSQSPDGDCDAADTHQQRPQGSEPAGRRVLPDGRAATDAPSDGRDEGRSQPARLEWGSDAAERGAVATDADGPGGEALNGRSGAGHAGRLQPMVGGWPTWGDYEPAIRRWEHILGRPAPAPTEPGPKGGQRLSPRFVEWMMGLPAGWVTDVPDLSRNAQLKALGNGVVPQQATAALRMLFAMEAAA